MRIALLFIDGVGAGSVGPHNPLSGRPWLLSQFLDGSGAPLPAGGSRHLVDTTFGVPGRPQSATNQTALYTGAPAPVLVGKHVLGYPSAALKPTLAERSIFARARAAGRRVAFANAYPRAYLDALGLLASGSPDGVELPPGVARRLKASASTLAFAASREAFRSFADARADRGLTHDITGEHARRRSLDVPTRSVDEAARIFWSLAADLTLFEHFLADVAGHAQDEAAAVDALATFDAFARAVVERRPADAAVVITSDHGNVEDLSTRNHTLNPVAVLSFGAALPPLASLAELGERILHAVVEAP